MVLLAMLFVSVACQSPAARQPVIAGQAGRVDRDAITAIALERRCFGCERELIVSVARDGTATKLTPGNARQGTVDRRWRATIAPRDFDELAGAVISSGFFALNSVYRDPQLADGASTTTTVTTDAGTTSVLDKHDQAPPGLRQLQARIDDLLSTLAWRAVP